MMKLKTILLCLSFFLSCSSQELTEGEQHDASVSEISARSHQTVDWDTARPPVTLTIRSGRQPSSQHEQYEPLVYSNEWRPILMSLDANSFGTRIPKREEMDANTGFQPTLLKRPDMDIENSSIRTQQNPQSSDPIRNSMNSASFSPLTPMFFYPPWLPESVPQGTQEVQNASTSQASSSFYSTNTENTSEETESIPSSVQAFPSSPVFLRQPPAIPDPDNSLASELFPFLPYFYPRPPPPNTERAVSAPIPTINVYARPPYVDREPGSNTDLNQLPPEEKQEPQSDEELPAADTLPTNMVPPDAPVNGPLPLGPYPFDIFSPPLLRPASLPSPPLPPRILARGPVIPPGPQVAPIAPENVIPGIFPPPILPPIRRSFDSPVETIPNSIPPSPPSAPVAAGSNEILLPSPQVNELPPIIGVEEEQEQPEVNIVRSPYEFGYDMNDGNGTDQHRREISDEAGVVTGSYGYRDAFGVYRLVNYIADKRGFRAVIKTNEPGVANPGSADVVVMAEPPPPHTIAEGAKEPDVVPVIVPDQPIDFPQPGGITK